MNNLYTRIEKTDNGYIITSNDVKYVIEMPTTSNLVRDEQIALAKVFYKLKDIFEVFNDKHINQYLEVTVTNTEEKE